MKQAKKLASLLLALVMVLALATTAFAADEKGSISITNAIPGTNYKVYKILSLESYDTANNKFSYKATTEWKSWLRSQTTYVTVDANDFVTWVDGANVVSFIAAAQGQLSGKVADGTATAPAAAEGQTTSTATVTDLDLGYYLVDSSAGALCGITTTKPNAEIEEKNPAPTVDKKVKVSTDDDYTDNNTAKVGDTVNFEITITAQKGAQDYVLHDVLSSGLTLNPTSITANIDTNNYTVETRSLPDGCSFEVKFTKAYLDTITKETIIKVTYSATVNANAVVEDAGKNKTKLSYGDESKTEWDETNTVTRKFDIVKTDSSNKLLAGAKFELYDAQTAGNEIKLVKVTSGTGAPYYRPALEGETAAVIETNAASKVTVKGLAGKTYWLEETEAPDGYNKLAGRVEVDLTRGDLNTSMTDTTWNEDNGGVHIENKSGTELPSTGGIGTTIFYVLGSILVIGAAVLLVTKKRMSAKN